MSDPKVPEGSRPEPVSQPGQSVEQGATQPIEQPGQPQGGQSGQPVVEEPAVAPVGQGVPVGAAAGGARGRFRRVAAHRGAQLVAVGVLGLIIGGGVVALLDHDGYGRGPGRVGISRMDERGPGPRVGHGPRGWENHGRFER
ncbi:hypothetical protein CLV43_10644 [Umezawaea tangerina]|uniref:Uncharacterized protein n=1 Tax=Umezawaea tangerina TaxID=84725 RepID=A0A2T0T3R0_9PSEU|nr:hypothetical protein CLV43_10644 [Umezawaea tangerina]